MNIAIVIDADNVSHDALSDIVKEAEKHGRVVIKRAYGDFLKNSCLFGWIEKLKYNGFEIRQNFNYCSGKNSTDIALVIDVMDIIRYSSVQGICIVSSDSDFTHLAIRVKSEGHFCMGIGCYATLPAFKNACDKFLYTEDLKPKTKMIVSDETVKIEVPKLQGLSVVGKIDLEQHEKYNHSTKAEIRNVSTQFFNIPDEDKQIVVKAYEMSCNNNGVALLSIVAEKLKQHYPFFNYKVYGYKKFSDFMKSMTDTFKIYIGLDGMTYNIQRIN